MTNILPGYCQYAASILQTCPEKFGNSSGAIREKKQMFLMECQEESISRAAPVQIHTTPKATWLIY
jgi:hypothetical protein